MEEVCGIIKINIGISIQLIIGESCFGSLKVM